MFHVLEHMEDPSSSLEKIWQLLKPGGNLIIEIPNAKSFDVFISKQIKKEVYHAPYHLFAFDKKNSCQLITKTGFKIIKQDVFFFNLFVENYL